MSATVSDPLAAADLDVGDVSFTEHFVEVEDGVRLRTLSWRPEQPKRPVEVLFVAGWVSAVAGWADLLRSLVRRYPVHYVETREKSSAQITRTHLGPADFSIARMAQDLATAATQLQLAPERTVVAGSSLGATSILEALKHEQLKARGAFLVGPNTHFRFPWWSHPMLRLPASAYHPLKHLILGYLRLFRVDTAKEPEQMRRYEKTLRVADALRMKLSARAVASYAVWDDLDSIRCPVALAFAPTDHLHGEGDIERLASVLPHGIEVRCPSNKYMHSAEVLPDIERFVDTLT